MALLSDDEVEQRLADLSGWRREGQAIVKEFRREGFTGSVAFVNELTPVAEELDHHPDLAVSWNRVKVSITTHSQGGLTEGDFELARRIDEL